MFRRLGLGALLAGMAALALPASAQQAQRPVFQVGTTCYYESTTTFKEGKPTNGSQSYTQTVTAVGANSTTMMVGASNTLRQVTPDGNAFAHGISSWSPAYPIYNFPLSVGKSWTVNEVTQTNSRNRDVTKHNVTGSVVSYENIVVSGISYATFKINVHSKYHATKATGSGSGTMIEDVWYAPSVGRMVKSEFTMTGWDSNVFEKTTHQLSRMGCGSK